VATLCDTHEKSTGSPHRPPSHRFPVSPVNRLSPSRPGETSGGSCKCGRGPLIPLQTICIVGSHYGQLSQPAELEGMPAAARALVAADDRVFARTDRGVVRNSNDKTMDNRVTHFRDWLAEATGYLYLCCVQRITSQQGILLIGSYIDYLARTPYNRTGALRKSCTLSKFVTAATYFFEHTLTAGFSMASIHGGKLVMHPKISGRLDFYKKWDLVKEKREPYTREMLSTFHQQVQKQESRTPKQAFLGLHSLVFDTQTLGIFTGSRVSEYAQPKSRKTVSRVPSRPGAAKTTALPIAFIARDFEFLCAEGRSLPHSVVLDNAAIAVQLNITFRYDKSGRNFTVRKFGRGSDWLCPITAARRLLLRADMLSIPPTDPICAFQPPRSTGHQWLLARDVTSAMRKICEDTYSDPTHYLREHVMNFASHSNRVTAAVALSQSGMSIDEIAHRLRWKPESVAFYLRESARDIGFYTANTIAGAQRDFVLSS